MPTKKEVEELVNQCTWTKVYIKIDSKTVYGYQIESRVNGKRIFLPCTGYYTDSTLNGSGAYYGCNYWTSNTVGDDTAYAIFFPTPGARTTKRTNGLAVRAVLE